MKHLKKTFVLLTTAVLFLFSSFPALAEEDREKIQEVSLTIEAELEDDDDNYEDMSLDIYAEEDIYSVDGYEVVSTSSSHPVIEVTLTAEDGYYFSLSSDNITLEGEDATLSSKSTKNHSETLILKIRLNDVSYDDFYSGSDDVGEARLDREAVGSWDSVRDAKKYEVRFYRDGTAVGSSVETKNTEYYFGALITRSGTYSFKVRTINMDNETSDWVESDSRTFEYTPDSSSPIPFTCVDHKDSSSGSSSRSSGNRSSDRNQSSVSSSVGGSGWVLSGSGWWYRYEDGDYPCDDWCFIDENWFHFDENGYMQTGWLEDGGLRYYLNPMSDGTQGRMVIGWHWIDGKCYYFNPASDGTKGALITNSIIDGQYRVGADGALIQ